MWPGESPQRPVSCYDDVVDLAPGQYTLTVEPLSGQTGSYKMELMVIPEPDEFDLGVLAAASPVIVEPGVPGVGAGVIETAFSEDRYQFSVDGAVELAVNQYSFCGTYPYSYRKWQLFDDATGNLVASRTACYDKVVALGSGQYTLTVEPLYGYTGSYKMELMVASGNSG